MRHPKQRLTVTVDAEVIRAGNDAVAAGRADSLSSWVNLALIDRIDRERRLAAMGGVIAEYEARFGTISEDELQAQTRSDRSNAIVVRGRSRKTEAKPKRRRTA